MPLTTDRLILREWRETDREPFARLNADPQVMEYFPAPLSWGESNALMERIQDHFRKEGFGLWAVEIPGVVGFAGFIGLNRPSINPNWIEIGWRLSPQVWGKGYATEGARRVLEHAFAELGLEEVISFTSEINHRSRALMERIGLRHFPDEDFLHPRLPDGHRLRRHVFYRITRPQTHSDRSRSPGR